MKLLNFIFYILIFVSFILTLLALIFIYKLIKIKTKYKQTTGKIIEIKEIKTSVINDRIYSIISTIIEYEVNKIKYKLNGKYYNKTMKIGDNVSILYHPNEPNKSTMKQGIYTVPFVLGILALSSIITLIILYNFI